MFSWSRVASWLNEEVSFDRSAPAKDASTKQTGNDADGNLRPETSKTPSKIDLFIDGVLSKYLDPHLKDEKARQLCRPAVKYGFPVLVAAQLMHAVVYGDLNPEIRAARDRASVLDYHASKVAQCDGMSTLEYLQNDNWCHRHRVQYQRLLSAR